MGHYSPIQKTKVTASNLTNKDEGLKLEGTFHECLIGLTKWMLHQDCHDSLNIYVQPDVSVFSNHD
jgi:hypothetical protein